MTDLLLVALLGAAGAVARFEVDRGLRRVTGDRLPWTTLVINVSGSMLLGVITGLGAHGLPASARLAVGTGFCGGYTTFSAASFECLRLLEQRRATAAVGVAAGGWAATSLAAALGLLLSQG